MPEAFNGVAVMVEVWGPADKRVMRGRNIGGERQSIKAGTLPLPREWF
jgi:hypothetical protein